MTEDAKDAKDKELEAIRAVISALEPLDGDSRSRVIGYVFSRLGLKGEERRPGVPELGKLEPAGPLVWEKVEVRRPTDVRALKEQKRPRNGQEMSAVVAYYLAELAPENERRKTIGTAEVEKYFKQANFPLPSTPRITLFKAKNAGYLDAAERGQYKLNPVGHNLVAHNLPEQGSGGETRANPPRKKPKLVATKGRAKGKK